MHSDKLAYYIINSETEFASSHSNSVWALLGDKSQWYIMCSISVYGNLGQAIRGLLRSTRRFPKDGIPSASYFCEIFRSSASMC